MTDTKDSKTGSVLEDLLISSTDNSRASQAGGLIAPSTEKDTEQFEQQMRETLQETEAAVVEIDPEISAKSWQRAREVVTAFRPVPWFIWRIGNFMFGRPGSNNKEISDGMVFGLRRLMFAAASDENLGCGEKVNDMRKAVKIVKPDIIAAISVIHAVSKRLASHQFERIWKPMLEDALLRAKVGWMIGQLDDRFGAGRTMLAGFAGRSGLAVLIATGTLEQARAALEMLSVGSSIKDVGLQLYGCEPLQVSAMLLSAAGCGRDAPYGTASYASGKEMEINKDNLQQARWLAAFTLCEHIRTGTHQEIPEAYWNTLGFVDQETRDYIIAEAKKLVRRGHDWNWLL